MRVMALGAARLKALQRGQANSEFEAGSLPMLVSKLLIPRRDFNPRRGVEGPQKASLRPLALIKPVFACIVRGQLCLERLDFLRVTFVVRSALSRTSVFRARLQLRVSVSSSPACLAKGGQQMQTNKAKN